MPIYNSFDQRFIHICTGLCHQKGEQPCGVCYNSSAILRGNSRAPGSNLASPLSACGSNIQTTLFDIRRPPGSATSPFSSGQAG